VITLQCSILVQLAKHDSRIIAVIFGHPLQDVDPCRLGRLHKLIEELFLSLETDMF
jgi:hypothetical protein